jgi:hypothetical protein
MTLNKCDLIWFKTFFFFVHASYLLQVTTSTIQSLSPRVCLLVPFNIQNSFFVHVFLDFTTSKSLHLSLVCFCLTSIL